MGVSVSKQKKKVLSQGITYIIHFQILIKVLPDIGTVILFWIAAEYGLIIQLVHVIEKGGVSFLFFFPAQYCRYILDVDV